MNKFFLILFLACFISCKKEADKKPNPKKIEKQNDTEAFDIENSKIKEAKSKLLVSFYESKNNKTVWLSPKKRKVVLDELNNSFQEGLNPNDYEVSVLNAFEKRKSALTKAEWIEYDLLLTNKLKDYVFHLSRGKLNPQKLYDNWDLKLSKIDIVQMLASIQESENPVAEIEKLKPNHQVYKKLKEALAIIATFPEEDFKTIEIKKKILPNETKDVLIDIKKRLIYWKDLPANASLTSVYDSEAVKAMKKFQVRHGLSADGIIGFGTIAALNFTKEQRKQQIIANLERWKWFPRNLGKEYIIINIPDFKLRVVKDQDTARVHRIVVGTIKRKTPILSSALDYAVFNPTWTVPPTILKEDIIPETAKNKGYLATKNIIVYDSIGNVVSPDNWNVDLAPNYRYVQSPGISNSLGMVKLNFPNRFTVYLHDTNHRDFFAKDFRSLSSGCVRVENPIELAEYLLNDRAKYNTDSITGILKNGKTKYVNFKRKINVQLLYWTAWSENNQLIFRDDIYGLDADLYSKLGNQN
ncbi:MAG: L,D-transpeptidase family protein [Bacteroidota bacterium]